MNSRHEAQARKEGVMSANTRGRLAYIACIILMLLAVYALSGEDPMQNPPSPDAVMIGEI
jgi:hypothetical protein